MQLLLAVPQRFFSQFLGSAEMEQLSSHYDAVKKIEPSEVPQDQWLKLLTENTPDVVVSCWGTSPVPESALPQLKYVAHLCGSIRSLISRDLLERGLLVTNWGNIHAPIVAECALQLTLCTLRKTTRWALILHRDKQWPQDSIRQGSTLFGRRIGLHGFGGIARELIKLLQPFQCPVSVYSAGVPEDFVRQHGVTPVASLEQLFSESDILIEVEALTPATRHSVTEDLLRRLPVGASFINVGRGAVVDEEALIRVAQEGRLEIGLDVYEREPIPADSPFLGLMNVTLSPHIGGPTPDTRPECGRRAVKNLVRFACGQQPEGLITPELYDRMT